MICNIAIMLHKNSKHVKQVPLLYFVSLNNRSFSYFFLDTQQLKLYVSFIFQWFIPISNIQCNFLTILFLISHFNCIKSCTCISF